MFQSAPRSEERGDALERATTPYLAGFNPRPAPRSGAMAKGPIPPGAVKLFQSAPRSEERGDAART